MKYEAESESSSVFVSQMDQVWVYQNGGTTKMCSFLLVPFISSGHWDALPGNPAKTKSKATVVRTVPIDMVPTSLGGRLVNAVLWSSFPSEFLPCAGVFGATLKQEPIFQQLLGVFQQVPGSPKVERESANHH